MDHRATVVGRDAVLDEVWRALGDTGTVLLEGPAGIGKTTVFRAVVERAAAAGTLVLSCAPTESETALPLAAVADLLAPLAALAEGLPEAQRSAVRGALTGESAVDERALASAVLALVDGAAGGHLDGVRVGAGATVGAGGASEGSGTDPGDHAPAVLVAVDDAPWLDPPSERALRFALRRITGPVGVLVARRTSGEAVEAAPLGLAEVAHVEVPPLGVGALHHLLRDRLGVNFGRTMVARLARDSGGNALLAIELARAMLRLPALPGPGDDLPVAASLQDLVAGTLAALDTGSVQAVRLAALLSAPTIAVLAAAGYDAVALEPPEEAGLLVVRDDGRIGFAHPTQAAAVRASIPSGVRRRLHRTLAGIVKDPDERARQLTRCVNGPNEAAATELEAAAVRAHGRGAPEIAADLFARAAELSADAAGEAAYRRRLTAIRCRFDSGDYAAAGPQARAIAAELSGERRAEALLLHAAVAWSADDTTTGIAAAREALTAVDPDSRLAGSIHAHLAVFVDLPAPAREHAEAAQRLLAGTDTDADAGAGAGEGARSATTLLARDDRALLASAQMSIFFNEVRTGRPPRLDLLDEALRLEDGEPAWLAGTIPAIWWKSIDESDRAVDRLTWMLDRAAARGDEPLQHELITHLGDAELLAGRFDSAARWISHALELGRQLDTGLAGETWLDGLLQASLGNTDAAAAAAAAGLRQSERTGEPWLRRINLHLAGYAALVAGRMADAASAYAALADEVDDMGLVEPLGSRFEADWVEAAVGAGDLAAAERAQARLARRHAGLPRPWTALGLARGAVLIAAATGGPVGDTVDDLLDARRRVPANVIPLDRARCLLVAGLAQRRIRRKAAAREALAGAIAEFDALGAAAHAARARAELSRVGAARSQDPTASALTATEDRVAALAARGRTNRSIADELFVSPKTVEANLARIYRKLRISGRAELGAALSARGT